MTPTPPAPGSDAPGWAPSPPGAPRRRRRWPWALGSVLGAIVVLAGVGVVVFAVRIYPPVAATQDFLADVDDRDFEQAHAQLCSADQDRIEPEGLNSLPVDDYSVDWFGVDLDGDRARVEYTFDDLDDERRKIDLHLRKEGGDWRPCLSDTLDDLFDFELG